MVCPRQFHFPRPTCQLGIIGRGLRHGLHDQGLPGVVAAGADRVALHALAASPRGAAALWPAGDSGGGRGVPALGPDDPPAGAGLLAVLFLARAHPPICLRQRPACAALVVLPAADGGVLPAVGGTAAGDAVQDLEGKAPTRHRLPRAVDAVAPGLFQPEQRQVADLHHAVPAAAGVADGPCVDRPAGQCPHPYAALQWPAQPGHRPGGDDHADLPANRQAAVRQQPQ